MFYNHEPMTKYINTHSPIITYINTLRLIKLNIPLTP